MGNQTSGPEPPSSSSSSRPIQRLLRPSNGLGLSRTELDRRCQPSGLYPSCQWDDKAIRRLIGDGKLAARMRGNEARLPADTECPICFLHYPAINKTRCCQAHVCTECFLQVRPQRDKAASCPFCNAPRVQVAVAKELDDRAILERDREEQKVIEAEIRSRAQLQQRGENQQQLQPPEPRAAAGDGEGANAATAACSGPAGGTAGDTGSTSSKESSPDRSFGSSLEEHTRLLRARSGSVASDGSAAGHLPPSRGASSLLGDCNVEDIAALAVAPEERARLEEEVRAQHSHPLAQRLQAEEAERRFQNDLSFYQSRSLRLHELRSRRELLSRTLAGGMAAAGSSASSGEASPLSASAPPRPGRDWNRIVQAFESGGASRQVQSLDDLVVLEAAILLSMEEEARRREQPPPPPGGAGESTGNDINSGGGHPPFDAAHHASQGFPLARGRALAGAAAAALRAEGGGAPLQSLVRSLQPPPAASSSSPSPSRRDRLSRRFGNDASVSAAVMMLRGITEEEQIAMAIAASLAESSGQPSSSTEGAAGAAAPSESRASGGDGEPGSGGGGENAEDDDDDDEEVITFEPDPDAHLQRGRQDPSGAVPGDAPQESAPPSSSGGRGSADRPPSADGGLDGSSRGGGPEDGAGAASDKVREREDAVVAAAVTDDESVNA